MCRYYRLISFVLAFLMVSCKSLPESNNDMVITYKSAAFKSWLLFDAPDNFYAPPSESLAIFLAPYGTPKSSQNLLGPTERSEELPMTRNYRLPGKEAACWLVLPEESAKQYTKIGITKRLPSSYPWEVDMTWDINTYMEGLDLKWLAKLCYQNKPGCIYLMPGYREYFTVPMPHMLAGYISPNIFIPARLITRSELDLSVIMDNIWLLYQLERGGWVVRTGRKTWRWSDKARALPGKSSSHTLAQLTKKEREHFKVLAHIGEGDVMPPIPCEVFRERHVIHPLDAESCLMRQVGQDVEGACRPRHDREGQAVGIMAPEEGINILLAANQGGINNMWKSIVRLEEYGTMGDMMKTYGCTIRRLMAEGGIPKRRCRIIYDQ